MKVNPETHCVHYIWYLRLFQLMKRVHKTMKVVHSINRYVQKHANVLTVYVRTRLQWVTWKSLNNQQIYDDSHIKLFSYWVFFSRSFILGKTILFFKILVVWTGCVVPIVILRYNCMKHTYDFLQMHWS